jgi:NitT/TauT family transport system substrate-binding protein
MMSSLDDRSRRSFLVRSASVGAAAAASFCVPFSADAQAATLKWANLAPGFTTLITDYMNAKGLDRANGVNLGKPTSYTSVSTYYNDFIAGNYDVCIGSWDTFAARYMAGVPLQYVCTLTTANMINIITPAGGPTTIKGLEGKTLAAPQSTGTYRMMRALIKELEGFDIQTEPRIQNVDNPAAPVTLVMANRADAALSWEPNISVGLKRVPDMKVLYNAGVEYQKKFGLDLPYFGVAVRKEVVDRDPKLVAALDKSFAQCLAGITGNVEEAVAIAGANSGIPADVLRTAISSGRLEFKHVSMADEAGRKTLRTAAEFLQRNGLLPKALDNGFFAG